MARGAGRLLLRVRSRCVRSLSWGAIGAGRRQEASSGYPHSHGGGTCQSGRFLSVRQPRSDEARKNSLRCITSVRRRARHESQRTCRCSRSSWRRGLSRQRCPQQPSRLGQPCHRLRAALARGYGGEIIQLWTRRIRWSVRVRLPPRRLQARRTQVLSNLRRP